MNRFILGFILFVGGLYLLLQAIQVNFGFGYGNSLYHIRGYNITSGYILILFMLGVGMLFFNGKNKLGWLITTGSLVALIFGVIANVRLSLQFLSAFDLILILGMLAGGLGLLLSSFVSNRKRY